MGGDFWKAPEDGGWLPGKRTRSWFLGRGERLEAESSWVTGDFIRHVCVMTHSYKNPKGGVWEHLHAGEPELTRRQPCQAPSSMRTKAPLLGNLHLAVDSPVSVSFVGYP